MDFFKKIKRNYLKDYLIFSVRRLEKIAARQKRWDVTPEILGMLTKLLLIYAPSLISESTVKGLKSIKIQTQFESLKSLEVYCHEFMNQTIPFIKGEESKKPRIESRIKHQIFHREVSITKFLDVETELQLKRALESLVVLSEQLDDHLRDVPNARRTILLNMLKDIIYPAYTAIERAYEVINSEDETN